MTTLYETIQNESLVSPSLMPLLFGSPKDRFGPLRNQLTLPIVLHDVCIFYSALVQMKMAYQCKRNSCTISDFFSNSKYSKTVVELWHGIGTDLYSESTVISFLKEAYRNMPESSELFGDDINNILNEVADDYNQLMKNDTTVSTHKTKNDLLALLKNLPLLQKTEYVGNNTFRESNLELLSEPFIFVDGKKVFVTTSAHKGYCNSQLPGRHGL